MRKPFAITLDVGSSRANHTGAWRTEWLYDAEEGPAKYEAAWRQIMQDNPFPAFMGRVCYRPCETACNRAGDDMVPSERTVTVAIGQARRRPAASTLS
jgi:NADPH-dependent glutamate synthase beta subunit-like oxidoreductase